VKKFLGVPRSSSGSSGTSVQVAEELRGTPRNPRNRAAGWLLHAVLIAGGFVTLFPLLWMISA